MRLRTFILISSASLAIFVLSVRFSWKIDIPISQEASAGKDVWQSHNCVSCHTLLGQGGYVGEDLTHIMAKRSPDEINAFFRHPPVIPPHQEEKHPSLTPLETQDIIAYFEYMRTIPTLGWPPTPIKLESGDIL
ncbi:Cytochrome c [Desulfitobacterium dichloroeliminans LMG P-21439]|uniref:Cytochrome c n=1 Tax=Desulfitobacterium dichloroeliminans (strain LMG P-21439 / DCA1) TaxID=871963 RepID=L0F7Q1_DESDL|nr:cytochrome c [Desulfitobacterium dichloroeliminans]AGA69030.1 Cytochrome c [Desulfitobacterium dichloroeliminans LMG P-21439]